MSSPNRFLKYVPNHRAITTTARRVIVVPFDQKTEAIILSSDDLDSAITLGSRICQRHIHVGDLENHHPIVNYSSDVILAEETDMLWLARYYSYRKRSFDFRFKCPACDRAEDMVVMLDSMRRKLFECGDPECNCHDINKRSDEVPDADWNSTSWMKDEWVNVPENHLELSPPSLVFSPEGYGELNISLQFLRVAQKDRIGRIEAEYPDQTLQVHLEEKVVGIDWISEEVSATSRKDIQELLKEMPLDLRLAIRDWLEKKLGGVDQVVGLKCPSKMCRREAHETVSFSSDFFLPRTLEV